MSLWKKGEFGKRYGIKRDKISYDLKQGKLVTTEDGKWINDSDPKVQEYLLDVQSGGKKTLGKKSKFELDAEKRALEVELLKIKLAQEKNEVVSLKEYVDTLLLLKELVQNHIISMVPQKFNEDIQEDLEKELTKRFNEVSKLFEKKMKKKGL